MSKHCLTYVDECPQTGSVAGEWCGADIRQEQEPFRRAAASLSAPQHSRSRQPYASPAATIRPTDSSDPRELPGTHVHWPLKTAGYRGKQSIRGDKQWN